MRSLDGRRPQAALIASYGRLSFPICCLAAECWYIWHCGPHISLERSVLRKPRSELGHPSADSQAVKVLELVRHGKMTTQEADQWAADHGEIFTNRPHTTAFDPMNEPRWTLPMVAAWIVQRSFDAVREHCDRYRAECRVWRFRFEPKDEGDDEVGYELGPAEPTNLLKAFGKQADKWSPRRLQRESSFDPGNELEFALRSGQLTATGIGPGNKYQSSILSQYWPKSRPWMKINHVEALEDRDHCRSFVYPSYRRDAECSEHMDSD